MKRVLPIVVIIFIPIGACWWFSSISESSQLAALSTPDYSQTATADAHKPCYYYSDPDSDFRLILPSPWTGLFVGPNTSSAELLTIQRLSPYLGSLLEQAYKLGDNRPLFVAIGNILSVDATFQSVQLYVFRVIASSNDPAIDQSFIDEFSDYLTERVNCYCSPNTA